MRPKTEKKTENEAGKGEVGNSGIVEPPHNLLPDKPADNLKQEEINKDNPPVGEQIKAKEKIDEIKTEEKEVKPIREPSEVLPSVDIKTEAPVASAGSAVPPISVPITPVESSYSEDKPKNKTLIWLIVFILILGLIAGVWWYMNNNIKTEEKKAEQFEALKPKTQEVTPSITAATAEAKLNAYEITVLNGSGVVGEASVLEKILEEGGFTVASTGNADNYDYRETVIKSKKNVEKNYLEKLKGLIGNNYILAKEELIEATESSDVVVVIGSKKKEE